MSVLCLTPPSPPCLSSVALRSCPPTSLPPLPISFRCSNTSVLFQHAALVLEYCYFNPLYASPSLSSVAAPFSLLPCALAYGKFALCQAALNSVTGTALSTAAAHHPCRLAHSGGQHHWRGECRLLHLVWQRHRRPSCCSSRTTPSLAWEVSDHSRQPLRQHQFCPVTDIPLLSQRVLSFLLQPCPYNPPALPIPQVSPCIALVQTVITFCQFNPRAVLPTALPPFLNHTECAVPFLAYALCVLRALNETACNSQAMRPNITATTAIQGTACSVDSKLVPLINRAIAVVQSRNSTVPYTRKVNGLPCTSTPAAVFSACQGLDVNVAVNSSSLFCPSLACAVAYTSYAACFLASSPCTAPTASVKYPACPNASHQVQTFLSVCSAAVASGSFPGYLRAPSPPPTGCTTTSAALFQQYVQPTLVMPACTLPNLYGSLTSAVQSNCYFSPLIAAVPPSSGTCSVSCAFWLSTFVACQQRLLAPAINITLIADAGLSSSQLQVIPVVQAAFAPPALCTAAQSCPSDRHLVPYVSTCLATLQTLPLLSCPAKVDGLLCTATPAAVMDTCLGLNVNNVATAAVVSSYTCPSLSCAVAYARYAVCYLRQTPCRAGATSANGTTAACPDATGQVSTFLSNCYQAVLRNSFTGYLLPPPQVAPTCNVTAISLFQAGVSSSSIIAGHTPCTPVTLYNAFALAVSQYCYFNPLVTSAPTYRLQCSVGCAYALSFYLSCYAKVANASAAALVRAANMSSKGTPPVVVFPLQYRNTTIVNGSLSCGLAQACSTPANPVLQAYAATCLTALQATTKVCVSPPAPVVIVPAPTANLTAFTSYTCAPYLPAVSTTCSTNLDLPIVGATLSARFPIGLFSRECARAVAQYAICYFNAQPPTNSTGSCCSLNQDVVILAKAAIAALSNSTIVNVNPPTLSQVTVAGVRCDTVAPQLLRACGVRLVGGEVLVIPGVVNCSLTCARLFTEYSACRLRTTAVCVGRTFTVSAGQSVTIPAYPSFPYVQASTNASVGQGGCVDVDSSVWSFLSFCNRTLTGATIAAPTFSSSAMPSSSSFPSSSHFSSSQFSSSSRVSSSTSSPPPTSAAFVTSSSPLPTYLFSIQLSLVGADFSVSIAATVVCQHTGGPLYAPNSIYSVVQMQGTRVYSSSSLNVTSAITAVVAPGGLGNNDNSFYPLAAVALNQDGLDYSLSPPAPLGGVTGVFDLLNLYSSDGKYREEGSSGTAEAVVTSTIAIVALFATQSSSSAFSSSLLTSSPSQKSSSSSPAVSSSTTRQLTSSRFSSSLPSSSTSSPVGAAPLLTASAPPFSPNSGGTVLTITGSNLLLNATYQCQFQLPSANLTSPATLTGTTALTCVAPSILPFVPVGNAVALLSVLLSSAAVAGGNPVRVSSSSGLQLLFYGDCSEKASCSGQGSCQLGACVCYTSAYTGSNCSIFSVPPTVQPLFPLTSVTFDSSSVALLFSVTGTAPFTYSITSTTPAIAKPVPTFQQAVGNTSQALFQWTTPVASLTPYAITVAVSNSFGSASVSFTLLVQASIAAFVTVSAPPLMPGGFFSQAQLANGITLSGYVTAVAPGASVAGQLVTLTVRGQVQRTQQARTNSAGSFSTLYFPYSSDVGRYDVLTSTNASVQATFQIAGITLSSSQPSNSVTASTYQSFTFVLTTVQNPSNVNLHNLTASSAGLAFMVSQRLLLNYSLYFSSDSANGFSPNSTSSVLPAGQSLSLLLTVTFPANVLYFSYNPTIYIASQEFVSASLVWTLQAQPPHPVLSLSPGSFSLVVNGQTVTTLTAQLSNGGSEVSGVVYVGCPAYSSGLPSLVFSNPNPMAVQPSAALVSTLESLSFIPSTASSSYLNQTLPSLLVPGVQFGSSASLPFQLVVDTSVVEGVYTVSCAVSAIDAAQGQVQSQSSLTVRVTVRSGVFTNLTFQVEDELTFFNKSAPYVSGATISIAQLGISQSLRTDYNGTVTFVNVPLGAYAVTVQAANHNGVSYTILVTPTTPVQLVFLVYTPVSYVFTVVPSLITDVISVSINAVFSTHVPIPIVTVSPNLLVWSQLESGVQDSIQFVLSNLGLIDALNVSFTLTHPNLQFLFAVNPLPLLPANSSVQIPVQVVKTGGGSGRRLLQSNGCSFQLQYQEPCANTPTQTVTVGADSSQSSCQSTGGGGGGYGSLVVYGGGYGGSVAGNGGAGGSVAVIPVATAQKSCSLDSCDKKYATCVAQAVLALILLETLIRQLIAEIAILAKVLIDLIVQEQNDSILGSVAALAAIVLILVLISEFSAAIAALTVALEEAEGLVLVAYYAALAACTLQYYQCKISQGGGGHRRLLQTDQTLSLTQTPFDQLDVTFLNTTSAAFNTPQPATTAAFQSASSQLSGSMNKLFHFFFIAGTLLGDPALLAVDLYQNDFMGSLINSSATTSDQGALISGPEYHQLFSNVSSYTPQQVTLMDRMVRRLNRTSYYNSLGITTLSQAEAYFGETAPLPTSADVSHSVFVVAPANTQWDFIYNDQFLRLANQVIVDTNDTQKAGYADLTDELANTASAYNAADVQQQQGICASVSVQLTKQTLTAEREDFVATLTIDNAQSTQLTGLSVALVITLGGAANTTALLAANLTSNDLFSISLPTVRGLSSGGIGGDGVLAPTSSVSITWTIIPYATAAPTSSPVLFSVSGDFAYSQGGVPFTVPLLPATITVYPSPVLVLDYFLPTVVYSDDPFTALVEPSIPFAVGLLVSNVGEGALLSLSLQSSPPVILDNAKGLLVSFSLLSTALNDAVAATTATLSAGNVAPMTVLDYRDTFSVSLMGTFVSYNLTLSESLASGDKRLALVQRLQQHQLVQTVYIPSLRASAYLCQELPSPPQLTDPFSIPVPDTLYYPTLTAGNLTRVSVAAFPLFGSNCSLQVDFTRSTLSWVVPTANQSGPVYYRCPPPPFPGVDVDAVYELPSSWRLYNARTEDGRVLQAVQSSAVGNVWLSHRVIYPEMGPNIDETYIHLFDPQQPQTGSAVTTYTLYFAPPLSSSSSAAHAAVSSSALSSRFSSSSVSPSSPFTSSSSSSSSTVQAASLCFMLYSLPGSVDYPFASSLSLLFTFQTIDGSPSVRLLTASGTRTFTNRFGSSVTSQLSLARPGLLYLGNALPVDGDGLLFDVSPALQMPGMGGHVAAPLTLLISNGSGSVMESPAQALYDPVGQAFSSTVPGFVNVTLGASNANAMSVSYGACQAGITFSNGLQRPVEPSPFNGAALFHYSYRISDGATYQLSVNLTVSTSSAFATTVDQLGNPYLSIVNVTGTRLYQHIPTGTELRSTVVGLSKIGSNASPPSFYPYSLLSAGPGIYTRDTVPYFDAVGVTFSVSPAAPQNGLAPAVGPLYSTFTLSVSTTSTTAEALMESPALHAPVLSLQQQQYYLH